MSSTKISACVVQSGLPGSNSRRKPWNNESTGKSVEWITIPIADGDIHSRAKCQVLEYKAYIVTQEKQWSLIL